MAEQSPEQPDQSENSAEARQPEVRRHPMLRLPWGLLLVAVCVIWFLHGLGQFVNWWMSGDKAMRADEPVYWALVGVALPAVIVLVYAFRKVSGGS